MADQDIRQSSLEYHRAHPPGKISILPTKQLLSQRDLALAYSPGVAAACDEIVRDPTEARNLTARGNLIGVITNGTAVLGLGAIGPLAAKPVMEGKAVLFKKFAGIDCFDIEIDERDPQKLVEIVAALEPTFGAINLEDIKAPECFTVERLLRKRMRIPVFHDDQHGTAITVGAAIYNGLKVVGKRIEEVKLVASGAGAAALACLDLLQKMGLPLANIIVTDIQGVVFKGRRELMDPDKERYAKDTRARRQRLPSRSRSPTASRPSVSAPSTSFRGRSTRGSSRAWRPRWRRRRCNPVSRPGRSPISKPTASRSRSSCTSPA